MQGVLDGSAKPLIRCRVDLKQFSGMLPAFPALFASLLLLLAFGTFDPRFLEHLSQRRVRDNDLVIIFKNFSEVQKVCFLKLRFPSNLQNFLFRLRCGRMSRGPSRIFVDDKFRAFRLYPFLQPCDLALGYPQQLCRFLPRNRLAYVSVNYLVFSHLHLSQCYRPFHALYSMDR